MKLRLVAYGIAKDIVGLKDSQLDFELRNIAELKQQLIAQYPEFGKLQSLKFAVNEEYCDDTYLLQDNDEIVIIPPVAGG